MISYKEIKKFVEDWHIWIGFIFLFIPGILYQINFQEISLSNFSGSLILVFLSLSLYYSLPFLIAGFFLHMTYLIPQSKKEKMKKDDFLLITFYSIAYYFVIQFAKKSLDLPFFSFWEIYLIFLGLNFVLN